MNTWFTAFFWMALALAASLLSIRTAISVSLMEIFLGVVGGNFLGLHTAPWSDFLAGFGSILLTFMAGAELEPQVLRRHLKASLTIGTIAFLFPFLGAWAFAYYVAGWSLHASQIAGIALSTTSVAVVYSVMVETGLNETELGKLILAACFVTDLGTVLALGVLFANYNRWLLIFLAVSAVVLAFTPKIARWFFRHFSEQVSEPGIKFLFLLLFGLGGLASQANSEAVLPAYVLGLVVAALFAEQKAVVRRLRTTVFALLTPFYFLKAGMFVSLKAAMAGAVLIGAFFLVKLTTKIIGVWPLTRVFKFGHREGNYTTLLMSTGLTFGTISALFGLTRQIITQSQYTILVVVVIMSAVIPTLIAQAYFRPHIPLKEEDSRQVSMKPARRPKSRGVPVGEEM